MWRSPGFTIPAALTLALALAANVAIFTMVHRVVLNPLPYPDADALLNLDHGAVRLPSSAVNQRPSCGDTPKHCSERGRSMDDAHPGRFAVVVRSASAGSTLPASAGSRVRAH